ncbi:hypothetical protein [Novilysobacter spongiicola]|uniref:Lipoprotein n=1 Tax=Lysobacter spongiicola DSM 21749 TaxID=1122188 RepID=A0A1T4Q7S1_9GAMM|nr:hypothetical protein [Lysobacter spongiicola]SJZ99258.1 hypothetical protein SAMN02745674_01512 [Lysobacter spongiicola DSM 21749]
MRLLTVLLVTCLGLLAGCASSPSATDALDESQYAWSGAIRWGDFEGAESLVDPDVRTEQVVTDLEMKRYEQIQVSYYRTGGSSRNVDAGTAVRDVEIGVINRHTMAERVVKYREQWRWDEEAGIWWNTSGLPDLWAE